MKKLTLGFSPCPNDTFIFDALVNKRIAYNDFSFETLLADVEELNQKAIEGLLDITKISIANYPLVARDYVILDAGSAIGNNNGPLIISKNKIDARSFKKMKVAIPGIHTTANLLMNIAFPEVKNKVVLLFSAIEDAVLRGEVDAGLIIHESRFTYAAKGLIKFADMGEYWENQFGQLLPLGCIIMKRSFTTELINRVSSLIRESIEYAYKYPVDSRVFIKQHSQEMADDIIQKHINLYVNQYSIDLGEKGRGAINFLFEKAASLGLLPKLNMPIFV